MRGEPATDPSSPAEDPEDVAGQLLRQVARLKRWVEWELWMYEPRSFSPPEESGADEHRDEEWWRDDRPRD